MLLRGITARTGMTALEFEVARRERGLVMALVMRRTQAILSG